jgi:predicted 3-demethylubiquinone-9 3-methyltransferase (glyoxalase superfamily)
VPLTMPKITPFLWFDTQAEEAANFYVSIFPNSKINVITRYSDAGPGPKGSVMTVGFVLDGQDFTALNGGPVFKMNEAVSFVVHCENQPEVDHYWEKLAAGGTEIQCAWLKDRYGVAWQIVPKQLITALSDPDPIRAKRAAQAMFTMKKIDIAKIEAAARGE